MARKSKGRQKVEMAKMSKESNLLVTFSKRRSGLFKKANELCTLCGVEVTIIVFSPGKKVYTFGHPNVEQILDKFLTGHDSDSDMLQPIEAHINARTHELNMQLTGLHDQVEAQEKYGEELASQRKQRQGQDWWEAPIEHLGLEQLQMLKSGLKELKVNIAEHTKSLAMIQQHQNFASSSSGEGRAADGSGTAVGIVMTPQGYALC